MIFIKAQLQQFVSKIEIKGRLETRDGKYTIYFNEFKDAEHDFLIKNKHAILEFLRSLECVNRGQTYMEDLEYYDDDGKIKQDDKSCFHITFHEDYCPNIPEENFN